MGTIGFLYAKYLPHILIAVSFMFLLLLTAVIRRNAVIRARGVKNSGRNYSTFRLMTAVCVTSLVALCIGLLLLHPYLRVPEERIVYRPFDIVIADDKSLSVLAQATPDPCGPSRMDVAVQEVGNFIDMVEIRKSDRLALVVFTRFGYRYVPLLTKDYDFFRKMWREVTEEDLRNGGFLGGTNHWDAVSEAVKTFTATKSVNTRVLIIITDGEPDAPAEVLAKSRTKALEKIQPLQPLPMYIIGVGDRRVGYPIPRVKDKYGCPKDYYIQTSGEYADMPVITQPDVAQLNLLAEELGGKYIHSKTGSDLSEIMQGILDRERIPIGRETVHTTHDLTKFLIMTTLALLILMVLLKTP